ncbi:uncharacterized protein LOC125645754 isoform X2 [Ostrea edulis]|uniref:uncharacterized protein LOC125645754 isoform X2 n=2 Tax=Ostrea edulis TaxID=37623 RepID=UPI0024AFEBB5|nr:uncharacterized protein LOC125645754 isoform X2 [Ostrea edulis]
MNTTEEDELRSYLRKTFLRMKLYLPAMEDMVQFEEKKAELESLVQQRKHEQYIKDGTTDIKQVITSHRGLGCGHKYDPRVKKKFQFQKTRVNLDESCNESTPSHSAVPTATDISCLPGVGHLSKPSPTASGILKKDLQIKDMKDVEDVNSGSADCQFSSNKNFKEHVLGQKGPFRHNKQLKNIFSGPKSSSFTPIPYKRKATDNPGHETGAVNSVKQSRGNDQSAAACTSHAELNIADSCHSKQTSDKKRFGSLLKTKNDKTHRSEDDEKRLGEKQKLADQYLFYRGGGWKKNWKGEWIKDEDVEFDSDEEPPDLP